MTQYNNKVTCLKPAEMSYKIQLNWDPVYNTAYKMQMTTNDLFFKKKFYL